MENCLICGNTNIYKNIEGMYICKECYKKLSIIETSDFAYSEWLISVVNFNKQEDGVDVNIHGILGQIDNELCINEQLRLLLGKLKEMIQLHLEYYNSNEVFVAFLTIRESIRRLLLKYKNKLDWKIINDISTTNLLLKITSDIPEDKYENNLMGSMENGASNFITAICLARRYNLIENNYKLVQNKNISINDICYTAIETESTKEFFSKYILNGTSEKVEDYVIKNKVLKAKLEKERKTPEHILNNLNELLKKEFGFERGDYNNLCSQLLKLEFPTKEDYYNYFEKEKLFTNTPLIVLKKSELEDICGHECLEAILNAFSVNRNIINCQFEEGLELFSFYETDGMIVVGGFDFAQNITTFEKFILSKDYIDFFKKSKELDKNLTKTQKKMSQYIAISVADYLYSKGYRLPMERYDNVLIPRAEIDKIKINGNQILSRCGDIDVLALDMEKKIVFLFEIKYYKPAISSFDMLYKDRKKIEEDEVLRKMKKREEVVLENIEEVVKYILGEYESGYTVKSILLTPRTNYYAVNEKNINYLTWAEFLDRAERKEL